MNKLIEQGDIDTVEIWAEEHEKEHKLAYLKQHHPASRDFVLVNNEKGERYTFEDGEWKLALSADNPTEADPEYVANRKAAAERAQAQVEAQLLEIAANPKNELHEIHYGGEEDQAKQERLNTYSKQDPLSHDYDDPDNSGLCISCGEKPESHDRDEEIHDDAILLDDNGEIVNVQPPATIVYDMGDLVSSSELQALAELQPAYGATGADVDDPADAEDGSRVSISEGREVFHVINTDAFTELQPITDLENYKPEPGAMLEGFEFPSDRVKEFPLDFPVSTQPES